MSLGRHGPISAEALALLCDPDSHEPLELSNKTPGPFLVSSSGRRFPIREGIPVFLEEKDVAGPNRRYQRLYDRLARFYDLSTWLYTLLKRTGQTERRMEYLRHLEVCEDALVLREPCRADRGTDGPPATWDAGCRDSPRGGRGPLLSVVSHSLGTALSAGHGSLAVS
jgi:uncharacterized protein YbaR (Trm112 family)